MMDKKFDAFATQEEMQKLWEQEHIYSFDTLPEAPVFSIDTPPPTVSGSLHVGHVFSYTHTDIIARYQRMCGRKVLYPMGFDDNGLATERFVEKVHKLKAHNVKRSEFIALCLKTSEETEHTFQDLWKRMGLSIDWSWTYSTISAAARKVSQYSFIDLYNQGLIYRKQDPALYCTTCRTTVAQAELDSNEVETSFNTLRFITTDGQELRIATTRPELLPACVAIFYHPDDKRYVHLQGTSAITPIFGKLVPLLPDARVEQGKGTGLVMCCTFGDQTDIYWFKTHKLPFIHVVGLDGCWREESGPLAGLKVHDARKKILELLDAASCLLEKKDIRHHVHVHERCKQEIEYLVLSQWFVSILDHKDEFIRLADDITWKPSFMKIRYQEWVNNLSWDWCISRQRFYGIPFPVWHCKDCKQILLARPEWLPLDPQEVAYPNGTCPACNSSVILPETDVMDTWNTSSLTPHILAGWPEAGTNVSLPMSMRPQAHDIIRTWAFYTIVKTYYHNKQIPWQNIVISGHVLSGKEKISKSQGNTDYNPLTLLKNNPADVIRYWTAQGKPGMDTAFSENQLRIGHRLITKLWNAFRFCMEHLSESAGKESKEIFPLDQWLLHYFEATLLQYHAHFKNYDYHLALEVSERFFWHYFCDNYIELVKDQFWSPEKYTSAQHASTQQTLRRVGMGILQMFGPFVPHVTEVLYQQLFRSLIGTVSLHRTIFEIIEKQSISRDDVLVIDRMVGIIAQVRRLKSEHQLSLNTPLARLSLYSSDQALVRKLRTHDALMMGITKADEICEVSNSLDMQGQQTLLSKETDLWVVTMNIDSIPGAQLGEG